MTPQTQTLERSGDHKICVDVDDAHVLDLQRSFFVPTRLAVRLGDRLTLGVRFRNCQRPLDVPVVVIGRRLQSGAGLLCAGVMVQLVPEPALLELFRDIALGHVTWGRVAPRPQPARVELADRHEAREALQDLLSADGAALLLAEGFARGDRLALDVVVDGRRLGTVNVSVRRIQVQDEEMRTVVGPVDAAAAAAAAKLFEGA
jgi:hypothetical protein